jgi:hypothetical protein
MPSLKMVFLYINHVNWSGTKTIKSRSRGSPMYTNTGWTYYTP